MHFTLTLPPQHPATRLRGGWHLIVALLLVSGAVGRGETVAPPVTPAAEAQFEAQVRPLLVSRCQGCHGATKAESGLRLDSRASLLKGDDAGSIVSVGDPAASRLWTAIHRSGDSPMPPDEPLSAGEVAILEGWVAAGLPWSGPGADGQPAAAGVTTDMEERLREALASHWSFAAPRRHVPPELKPAAEVKRWTSPLDRFLAAGIAAAGLEPSPEAKPGELVRRVWFDLTGLPPPAAEVDAFSALPEGEREAAYAALVERLLAAPEHAEHWARKWLDLARYADTSGYALDKQDNRYPFAWTYRDWVVGALQRDLPYDQFLVLQLAADRLQPAVPSTDLAALGFLTVGRTFLGNQHDIIDDRIDLVTRGLMGLSVACARCHDHKYEPVSTADYYALHGIFASSHMPGELPVIVTAEPGPEAAAYAEKLAELKAAIPVHEENVYLRGTHAAVSHAADYFFESARPSPRKPDNRPPRLADGYDLAQVLLDRTARLGEGRDAADPLLGPWIALRSRPDAEIAAAVTALVAAWGDAPAAETINPLVRDEIRSAMPTTLRDVAEAYARLVMRVAPPWAGGPEPQASDPAELVALRKVLGEEGTALVVARAEAMQLATIKEGIESRRLQKAVTQHEVEALGGPQHAMVLLDTSPLVDSPILLRGNPGRPGEVVERRLPKLLGGTPADRQASGRLELARGIASADNPLTPRLIVNWVWTHHFGRGLVDTTGDLGLRGEPPSHPELLDDLSRRFVEEGHWSLRWLHREIVTSRAWRQTSAVSPALAQRDPDNQLYARANRRRLDWEAWRDSLLVAAGTLDLTRRGGPGMNPLAKSSLHRRTLYTRLDRQDVPGILRTFDIANPDTSVHTRSRTSVPQQSLVLLNAPLTLQAAAAVSARTEREVGPDAAPAARIERLWRDCLSRSPTLGELAAATAWMAAAGKESPAGDSQAAGDKQAAAEQQVASEKAPAEFGPWEQLAQALLATAEFQFID